MREPMTAEDFAFKVDSEGGVMSALQYGLTPEDAPDGPIRDLWSKIYELWQDADPIRYDLGVMLDEIRESYYAAEAAEGLPL
jgi:hypothetical protein